MALPDTSNTVTVPFYLKKADRPKATRTVYIFADQKETLELKYKDQISPLFRYLAECFLLSKMATPMGFSIWLKKGEKF